VGHQQGALSRTGEERLRALTALPWRTSSFPGISDGTGASIRTASEPRTRKARPAGAQLRRLRSSRGSERLGRRSRRKPTTSSLPCSRPATSPYAVETAHQTTVGIHADVCSSRSASARYSWSWSGAFQGRLCRRRFFANPGGCDDRGIYDVLPQIHAHHRFRSGIERILSGGQMARCFGSISAGEGNCTSALPNGIASNSSVPSISPLTANPHSD
jgi:hypothetical protein